MKKMFCGLLMVSCLLISSTTLAELKFSAILDGSGVEMGSMKLETNNFLITFDKNYGLNSWAILTGGKRYFKDVEIYNESGGIITDNCEEREDQRGVFMCNKPGIEINKLPFIFKIKYTTWKVVAFCTRDEKTDFAQNNVDCGEANEIFDSTSFSCKVCPERSLPNSEKMSCVCNDEFAILEGGECLCKDGFVYSDVLLKCVCENENQHISDGACVPNTEECAENEELVAEECACKSGFTRDLDGKCVVTAITCGEGETYDEEKESCVPSISDDVEGSGGCSLRK